MAKFSQIFLIAEITIGINLYWNRANRGVCVFRPNCGIWEPQIRALNWYLKSTLNKIYTST